MRNSIILSIVNLILCSNSLCQEIEWVSRYNYANYADAPFKIKLDSQGNIYIVGVSQATETLSGFITIKYNSGGNQEWIRSYFPNVLSNLNSGAYGIDFDSSNNVYVSGEMSFSSNSEDYDILTLKYNSDGLLIWENRTDCGFNDLEFGRDLIINSDGYIYACALVYNNNENNAGVIKIDPLTGNTIWILLLNEVNYYDPRYIKADSEQNIYIAGSSRIYNSINYDYFISKITANQNILWTSYYNGTGNDNDMLVNIFLSSSNECYVTGSSVGNNTYSDIATIKYNTLGYSEWIARYNGAGDKDDVGNSIKLDNQNNIYICGVSENLPIVIKYNDFGKQIWENHFMERGAPPGEAISIEIDNDNNVYIMGNFLHGYVWTTSLDFLMYSLNSNGEQNWWNFYDYQFLDDGWLKGGITGSKIGLDKLNNIYVTGVSKSHIGGEDIATLKISNQDNLKNKLTYNYHSNFSLNTFKLYQNYPNPFNPSTVIRYDVPEAGFVTLKIYDALGKEIMSLINGEITAGSHEIFFDGSNLTSGIYFYKIQTEKYSDTKKMLLVK